MDDPIAAGAADIMQHVNDDHGENLLEYLRAFTGVTDATEATMTGVDRLGFDVLAVTPGGDKTVRIAWASPLDERRQVREEMVRLTQEAQAALRE